MRDRKQIIDGVGGDQIGNRAVDGVPVNGQIVAANLAFRADNEERLAQLLRGEPIFDATQSLCQVDGVNK